MLASRQQRSAGRSGRGRPTRPARSRAEHGRLEDASSRAGCQLRLPSRGQRRSLRLRLRRLRAGRTSPATASPWYRSLHRTASQRLHSPAAERPRRGTRMIASGRHLDDGRRDLSRRPQPRPGRRRAPRRLPRGTTGADCRRDARHACTRRPSGVSTTRAGRERPRRRGRAPSPASRPRPVRRSRRALVIAAAYTGDASARHQSSAGRPIDQVDAAAVRRLAPVLAEQLEREVGRARGGDVGGDLPPVAPSNRMPTAALPCPGLTRPTARAARVQAPE